MNGDANYFEDVVGSISEDITSSEISLFSPAQYSPDYCRNRPYYLPVMWKDWVKRHGVERPYATPFDEYIQNVHTPTREQLELRWAGMPECDDIGEFWNTPKARIARARYQAAQLSDEDIAFASTPEAINKERFLDLLTLQAEKQRIETELQQEKRMKPERVGSPQEGWRWEEVERIITLGERSQMRRDLVMIQAAIDAIREKPKVEGEGDSNKGVRDIYIQVMTENNHVGSLGIPMNKVQAEIARREKLALEADAKGEVYDDMNATVRNVSNT